MRTRNKYRNNLQDFESLIHHHHSESKRKKDKVLLCESVGNIEVVRQLAKSKMNDLIIHTTDGLKLHVHHHGISKVHIRGFDQIYDIYLQALPGNSPYSFK